MTAAFAFCHAAIHEAFPRLQTCRLPPETAAATALAPSRGRLVSPLLRPSFLRDRFCFPSLPGLFLTPPGPGHHRETNLHPALASWVEPVGPPPQGISPGLGFFPSPLPRWPFQLTPLGWFLLSVLTWNCWNALRLNIPVSRFPFSPERRPTFAAVSVGLDRHVAFRAQPSAGPLPGPLPKPALRLGAHT